MIAYMHGDSINELSSNLIWETLQMLCFTMRLWNGSYSIKIITLGYSWEGYSKLVGDQRIHPQPKRSSCSIFVRPATVMEKWDGIITNKSLSTYIKDAYSSS